MRSGRSRSSGWRSRARHLQRAIGRVERGDDLSEKRARGVVGRSVHRGLRLVISELRGRAHHHTVEGMAKLATLRVDDGFERERWPIFVRAQRAQIIRNTLRQHRHHAIGEINRVAALERFSIERGTWCT